MAPTLALAVLGLVNPACCCGGTEAPLAGPPGSISGQIFFPSRMTPSRLAVYAVSTYNATFDARYVVTWIDPPSRTYQLTVPPGEYEVVARLDSQPLSSAGHVVCQSITCGPVMTRAGFVTCHTSDCQPLLAKVWVAGGQGVTGVDIGGWGSLNALDLLWSLDEFGAPGPITRGPSPSPQPQLPRRDLPAASTAALPVGFDLPYQYGESGAFGRMHLPAGWRQVPNPARAVDTYNKADFSNEHVQSPLSLDAEGVWLTVIAHCWGVSTTGATSTARIATDRGPGDFYFEDPHSPLGQQPFSGYTFAGLRPLATDGCLSFRFTVASEQVLEADLPTFIAIVQQSD